MQEGTDRGTGSSRHAGGSPQGWRRCGTGGGVVTPCRPERLGRTPTPDPLPWGITSGAPILANRGLSVKSLTIVRLVVGRAGDFAAQSVPPLSRSKRRGVALIAFADFAADAIDVGSGCSRPSQRSRGRFSRGRSGWANRANGHQMTVADKRHAIELALRVWPERSGRELGEQIGVHQTYVSRIREELKTSLQLPDRVVGRDGKSPEREPQGHLTSCRGARPHRASTRADIRPRNAAGFISSDRKNSGQDREPRAAGTRRPPRRKIACERR